MKGDGGNRESPRDRIFLRGLEVSGRFGVEGWERETDQPLLVDVEVFLDLSGAGEADRMEAALDYTVLAERVRGAVGSGASLLEAVAERAARAVLSLPGARACRVRVRKPTAALLLGAEDVACEVYREGM